MSSEYDEQQVEDYEEDGYQDSLDEYEDAETEEQAHLNYLREQRMMYNQYQPPPPTESAVKKPVEAITYTAEQISVQKALTVELEAAESILRANVERTREEFQRAQEAFRVAGEKHRPIREQLTRARGLLHMMTATEDLGDERNSTKIDRDSLSVALSFLDRNDWRVSRHWQVCRWWYLTMKKAGPHHLWRRHDFNHSGRLFQASPLRHHFTRISVNGDAAFLKWMVKELPAVWDLNLLRYHHGFDLSPLLGMMKLRELVLPEHQARTAAELDIIKRLPALEDIRQPVNASDLDQLLKAPSRISEWKKLDISVLGDHTPTVLQYLRHFSSLEILHFTHHVDPDGELSKLVHLKKLFLVPQADWSPLTLLESYGKSLLNLRELILHIDKFISDEATTQKQVSELFLSDAAPNLAVLHIGSVYTLSDLSCLTKLTKLQRLSFNGRLMFTAENLLKLSSLRHLTFLEFWLGHYWSHDAQQRYFEIVQQKSVLPSFFPALQQYNLAGNGW